MSETLYALIAQLADGKFHSGEALGSVLGISRSAVWKSLQQLDELGLELQAVSGRGYKLSEKLELLVESNIRSLLLSYTVNNLNKIEIFHTIDSTNSYLKQQAEPGIPSGTVCLAESQSAGRGRRGRNWHSPYGSNLYLSILWRFDDGMAHLAGLSLAVAVAMMRSFNDLGAVGLGIKWPNDIISEHGKLAGILVDVTGETSGPCHAVIGIGVNYAMSNVSIDNIDQPWTQLNACGVSQGRNVVAASLLNYLTEVLMEYQQNGFHILREEWLENDLLRDREVILHMANGSTTGIARGIDHAGLLQVEQHGVVHNYAAGEVSLRRSVR